MDILGLSTSPSSGGAYALILNETEGGRRLPIIIGTYEAQAIALELEHIKPPRPMTHDLLKNIIHAYQSAVRYVIINDLREGTFFSQIVLDSDSGEVEVDARPSDAIALAIRFSAPIFASAKVLDEAGIEPEQRETSEVAAFDPDAPKPSPQREGPHSQTTPQTRIQLLEKNLAAAIASEDYELAAKLRDELLRLKG